MTKTLSLPTPRTIQQQLPLSSQQALWIAKTRQIISNILAGKDPRLLLIVGPCSLHDLQATREYAERLAHLSSRVSDRFFIIMRAYLEKPRTSLGWKGLLQDPFIDNTHDIDQGLLLARKLLFLLVQLQIPAAYEFLGMLSVPYLLDMISWGCIGARTSASQPHRELASSLPLPVGMKNSVDGNIDIAIQGIITSQAPHTFIGINDEGTIARIQSKGNPDTHLVLRGGPTPNYDRKSLNYAQEQLLQAGLSPRLLVDCAHGNSCKNENQQEVVFRTLIEEIKEGHSGIAGILLESHLQSGNQSPHPSSALRYGISITDPCIGWEATEALILEAHHRLQ